MGKDKDTNVTSFILGVGVESTEMLEIVNILTGAEFPCIGNDDVKLN